MRNKLTESEITEICEIKAEASTLEDTFDAWVNACRKLKELRPDLRGGDLVIHISRLMYLAGFREGLETLNEGIVDEIGLPDLKL